MSKIACHILCAWLFLLLLFPAATTAETRSDPPTPKIQVRETVVFDGLKGWEHNGTTYRLACGACIAEMPNGDLLCWWLSGSGGEPSRDNNVLAARSTDKGKTWSEPYVLLEAGKDAGALTAMQVTPKGTVIAFGAEWPSELQYTVWHFFRMESHDNGRTWSPHRPLHIRESDNIMFGSPIRLKNGEYLLSTSFFEKRPIPLTASIQALAEVKSEAEALALPPDPTIKEPNKFATHLHGCSALTTRDPNLTHLKEHQGIRNRPLGLLESTVVQLRDERLVMLMRAEYGGFLWRSESTDNGRTWCDAWQTDIPNPTSMAKLIRVPDGRIVLIHNASGGVVGKTAARDPLSIWVSNDEMKSWYLKQDVITSGQLAYPCPILLDGKLVFVYDHNRRETRFVEVDLPAWAESSPKTSISGSASPRVKRVIKIGPFAESDAPHHQEQIQAILNAAPQNKPVVFQFQPGTYHITSSLGIRVPARATLQLANARFVLPTDMKADGQVFLVDRVSHVTFMDGEILGNRSHWDAGVNIAGIRVLGPVKQISVINTRFKDLSSNAIGVFAYTENNPARHILIKGVQIENCCNDYGDYLSSAKGPAVGSKREDQGGIAFYYVNDWAVTDAVLTRSHSDGTHFYHSHNGCFQRNTVSESQMGGYFLEGCRNVIATANQIRNNGSRGVTIERDSTNCVLQNNLITGSGREGLWAPDVEKVRVTGNVFKENGQKDDAEKDCEIRLDETSEYATVTRDICIQNNFFFTQPQQTAAIYCSTGVAALIDNNIFSGEALSVLKK